MRHQIDLNSLLPEGIRFTPLFEKEYDYREFRERYAVEVRRGRYVGVGPKYVGVYVGVGPK